MTNPDTRSLLKDPERWGRGAGLGDYFPVTDTAHEDAALKAFRDELTARGREAVIAAYPDRDPQHPLDVDALVRIDGEEWAVDHSLIARPPTLIPALKQAGKVLKDKLMRIAQDSRCNLLVSYQPQVGQPGKKWGTDYYE